MDNLCHTLVGAALAQAGPGRRTRYGLATAMIAANLPDVDVAVFHSYTGWVFNVLNAWRAAGARSAPASAAWETRRAASSRGEAFTKFLKGDVAAEVAAAVCVEGEEGQIGLPSLLLIPHRCHPL